MKDFKLVNHEKKADLSENLQPGSKQSVIEKREVSMIDMSQMQHSQFPFKYFALIKCKHSTISLSNRSIVFTGYECGIVNSHCGHTVDEFPPFLLFLLSV